MDDTDSPLEALIDHALEWVALLVTIWLLVFLWVAIKHLFTGSSHEPDEA